MKDQKHDIIKGSIAKRWLVGSLEEQCSKRVRFGQQASKTLMHPDITTMKKTPDVNPLDNKQKYASMMSIMQEIANAVSVMSMGKYKSYYNVLTHLLQTASRCERPEPWTQPAGSYLFTKRFGK
jgi:hypothetical protein